AFVIAHVEVDRAAEVAARLQEERDLRVHAGRRIREHVVAGADGELGAVGLRELEDVAEDRRRIFGGVLEIRRAAVAKHGELELLSAAATAAAAAATAAATAAAAAAAATAAAARLPAVGRDFVHALLIPLGRAAVAVLRAHV